MLPYTYVAVYSSPISIMATTMVAALTQMLLSIPPLATPMLMVCNAATFYYGSYTYAMLPLLLWWLPLHLKCWLLLPWPPLC